MFFDEKTDTKFITERKAKMAEDYSARRLFDEYVKEWLNDFNQIRESHKSRFVPTYVETEDRELQ